MSFHSSADCNWIVGNWSCVEASTGNTRNLVVFEEGENKDAWKMAIYDEMPPDKNGEEWETHRLSDKPKYVPEALSYEAAACQPISNQPPGVIVPKPADPVPAPAPSPVPPPPPPPETNELKVVRRAMWPTNPDFSEKIFRKKNAEAMDISLTSYNKTKKMFGELLSCTRKPQ